MVKRYYIQDYPEYFGSVRTGLRIASKIMSCTFRSITQSNNAQSTEEKAEQSTNDKCEAGSKFSFRNKK